MDTFIPPKRCVQTDETLKKWNHSYNAEPKESVKEVPRSSTLALLASKF